MCLLEDKGGALFYQQYILLILSGSRRYWVISYGADVAYLYWDEAEPSRQTEPSQAKPVYDSIYRRTYFWREVCCTVSAGSTRTGARNIDTESVRCRVIKPHTSQPKPSQAIVWQHVPDDVLLGSDTPYGICYVHKQSEGLWLKPSRSINLNPHDTTRQIIITGGDQQQRRILFLLFYFIHFHITTYQRWHWSIRCHARSISENFPGICIQLSPWNRYRQSTVSPNLRGEIIRFFRI